MAPGKNIKRGRPNLSTSSRQLKTKARDALHSDKTDGSTIMPPSAKKRCAASHSKAGGYSHKKASRFLIDELDDVILTTKEEREVDEYFTEFLQLPYLFQLNFQSFSASDDGSNSSPDVSPRLNDSFEDSSEAHASTLPTTSASKILQRLPFMNLPEDYTYTIQRTNRGGALPVRQPFINFFHKHQVSDWNRYADQVYSYLNAAGCIVDPRYFLSISACEDDETLIMDSIFKELERDPRYGAWSTLPDFIEEFLTIYDNGFEQLAHRVGDKKFASKEFARFRNWIRFAARQTKFPKYGYWYSNFLDLAQLFTDMDSCGEPEFYQYVKHLMDMFSRLTGDLPFVAEKRRLHFGGPKRGKLDRSVTPAVSVKGNEKGIFLVGEVKRFGSHGINHEEHRGGIPKHREANPQKTVSESGRHENEQPTPGPSTGSRDRGDAMEDGSFCPYRRLNKREDYKLRCYLPQLLGQLLCAMQINEKPLPLSNLHENVQLGFGVEGFKLRFIKLVLRCPTKEHSVPNVIELFSRPDYRCDVFVTQEFNLMKKSHLKMFFKMLVAITYVMHR